MDVVAWEQEMAALLEMADYSPGDNIAPGDGTEGDDPLGQRYADLGHLAFVLNEAVDSACTRGASRNDIVEQIAEAADEDVTGADVDEVLNGDVICPDPTILQGFAQVLQIDLSILVDAAERDGCKNYSQTPTVPPGY